MQRLLAGGRTITISTYPDFSFRDEWSGVFALDEKILNYLAVKTEWGWAAPDNAVPEQTTVGADSITFQHEVNGHEITIGITVHPARWRGMELDQLILRVEGSNANELELGVCGRHAYDQNCGDYEIKDGVILAGRHGLAVFPDGGTSPIAQDMGAKTQLQGSKQYNIHVIRVPFEKSITMELKRNPPRFVKAAQAMRTSFSTDSAAWNELYRKARATIEILVKRRGWYAGLPWFVQYWGRDTFISLPALVREGYAPLARNTILEFTCKMKDGEVPRLIREDGTPEFGSIDTNPLLLNAIVDYSSISGDYKILAEKGPSIHEAFTWIMDRNEETLAKSKGKDTWMDTLEVRRYPVEVAAYTVSAARKLARQGILPGETYGELLDLWNAEKRKYLLERSANILIAAMYDLIPPEEALRMAKEWKLITEQGVRSWSPLEAEYDPRGYHTGATWGLTTAAGLYVALDARDWDTAKMLRNALLARAVWTKYLDEVWDSTTGEPIGADAQLWTAATIIRAIDEVIVNKRHIPPDITRIRRIRWEKGGLKKVRIESNHQ